MAVSLNHNILLLLAQSRLRENLRITQNRQRNAERRFNRYVRRRRLVSSLFFRFLLRFLLQHLPVRRIWLKPRSQIFWEETCQDWQEKDWNENFRMSKKAFNAFAENFRHISLKWTPITGKPLQCVIESPKHGSLSNDRKSIWCRKIHCLWYCATSMRGDSERSSQLYKRSPKSK